MHSPQFVDAKLTVRDRDFESLISNEIMFTISKTVILSPFKYRRSTQQEGLLAIDRKKAVYHGSQCRRNGACMARVDDQVFPKTESMQHDGRRHKKVPCTPQSSHQSCLGCLCRIAGSPAFPVRIHSLNTKFSKQPKQTSGIL